MPRESLDVGAFTWNRIQGLYDADSQVHWNRCEAEGFECPHEVFAQLFHEDANNADFAVIVRATDWGRMHWEVEEFSGIALRHVRVDRGLEHDENEVRAGPLECTSVRRRATLPSRALATETMSLLEYGPDRCSAERTCLYPDGSLGDIAGLKGPLILN